MEEPEYPDGSDEQWPKPVDQPEVLVCQHGTVVAIEQMLLSNIPMPHGPGRIVSEQQCSDLEQQEAEKIVQEWLTSQVKLPSEAAYRAAKAILEKFSDRAKQQKKEKNESIWRQRRENTQ